MSTNNLAVAGGGDYFGYNAAGNNNACAGGWWYGNGYNNYGWTFLVYNTTTITYILPAPIPLHAKCDRCEKTEPATTYTKPAGWYTLETGGVTKMLCCLDCVAKYAKPSKK